MSRELDDIHEAIAFALSQEGLPSQSYRNPTSIVIKVTDKSRTWIYTAYVHNGRLIVGDYYGNVLCEFELSNPRVFVLIRDYLLTFPSSKNPGLITNDRLELSDLFVNWIMHSSSFGKRKYVRRRQNTSV
jgi:hypothetical protein